jgi:hypothetical protein
MMAHASAGEAGVTVAMRVAATRAVLDGQMQGLAQPRRLGGEGDEPDGGKQAVPHVLQPAE